MAHFAELDNWGYVKRVVVIDNNDLLDKHGNESEQKGIMRCQELFGGNWIQTSYNKNFRGKFAAPNDYYDQEKDVFR